MFVGIAQVSAEASTVLVLVMVPPKIVKASSGSIITFAVVCRVGEHHNRLAHQCSPCENLHTHTV